ncbi:Replication factor A protein 1 [Ranunculus cassubicifolius]
MLAEEETESYTCKATVVKIYHDEGWKYKSCGQCKKKLKPKQPNSQYWCEKCNKPVAHSTIRIKIQFRVRDNTGEQDLTAFEEVATDMLRKTVDELLALKQHNGNDAVTAELDEMIVNEYYFQIKINDFNILHKIRTLTAVSATPTYSPRNKSQKIND